MMMAIKTGGGGAFASMKAKGSGSRNRSTKEGRKSKSDTRKSSQRKQFEGRRRGKTSNSRDDGKDNRASRLQSSEYSYAPPRRVSAVIPARIQESNAPNMSMFSSQCSGVWVGNVLQINPEDGQCEVIAKTGTEREKGITRGDMKQSENRSMKKRDYIVARSITIDKVSEVKRERPDYSDNGKRASNSEHTSEWMNDDMYMRRKSINQSASSCFNDADPCVRRTSVWLMHDADTSVESRTDGIKYTVDNGVTDSFLQDLSAAIANDECVSDAFKALIHSNKDSELNNESQFGDIKDENTSQNPSNESRRLPGFETGVICDELGTFTFEDGSYSSGPFSLLDDFDTDKDTTNDVDRDALLGPPPFMIETCLASNSLRHHSRIRVQIFMALTPVETESSGTINGDKDDHKISSVDTSVGRTESDSLSETELRLDTFAIRVFNEEWQVPASSALTQKSLGKVIHRLLEYDALVNNSSRNNDTDRDTESIRKPSPLLQIPNISTFDLMHDNKKRELFSKLRSSPKRISWLNKQQLRWSVSERKADVLVDEEALLLRCQETNDQVNTVPSNTTRMEQGMNEDELTPYKLSWSVSGSGQYIYSTKRTKAGKKRNTKEAANRAVAAGGYEIEYFKDNDREAGDNKAQELECEDGWRSATVDQSSSSSSSSDLGILLPFNVGFETIAHDDGGMTIYIRWSQTNCITSDGGNRDGDSSQGTLWSYIRRSYDRNGILSSAAMVTASEAE